MTFIPKTQIFPLELEVWSSLLALYKIPEVYSVSHLDAFVCTHD